MFPIVRTLVIAAGFLCMGHHCRKHQQCTEDTRFVSLGHAGAIDAVTHPSGDVGHASAMDGVAHLSPDDMTTALRRQLNGTSALQGRITEIKTGQAYFLGDPGTLVKGVLLYSLISVDSKGQLHILLLSPFGRARLPTESLTVQEASFESLDPQEFKIKDPKLSVGRAVSEELGHRLLIEDTLDEIKETLDAGLNIPGIMNYVQAAQTQYNQSLQHVTPVLKSEAFEAVVFGPPFVLFQGVKGGIPTKMHGQIVFGVVAEDQLPEDMRPCHKRFFSVEYEEDTKKNEIHEFSWKAFDLGQALDDLVGERIGRGPTLPERSALVSEIHKISTFRTPSGALQMANLSKLFLLAFMCAISKLWI